MNIMKCTKKCKMACSAILTIWWASARFWINDSNRLVGWVQWWQEQSVSSTPLLYAGSIHKDSLSQSPFSGTQFKNQATMKRFDSGRTHEIYKGICLERVLSNFTNARGAPSEKLLYESVFKNRIEQWCLIITLNLWKFWMTRKDFQITDLLNEKGLLKDLLGIALTRWPRRPDSLLPPSEHFWTV